MILDLNGVNHMPNQAEALDQSDQRFRLRTERNIHFRTHSHSEAGGANSGNAGIVEDGPDIRSADYSGLGDVGWSITGH